MRFSTTEALFLFTSLVLSMSLQTIDLKYKDQKFYGDQLINMQLVKMCFLPEKRQSRNWEILLVYILENTSSWIRTHASSLFNIIEWGPMYGIEKAVLLQKIPSRVNTERMPISCLDYSQSRGNSCLSV
jgi:hypothetical protein